MATELQLYESGRATADANGRAQVEMRSAIWGEWWRVTNASVSGNSVLEPQLKVYRGFVSDTALIGGSLTGNLDSATGNDVIQPNESVIFVWTGATPGAQFTATVTGVRWR